MFVTTGQHRGTSTTIVVVAQGVIPGQIAVTATATVTNATYSVLADGGYGASGGASSTQIVDAQASLSPLLAATLTHLGNWGSTEITVPGGSVFEETVLAYTELVSPTRALPSVARFAGRAFRLDSVQGNQLVPGLALAEAITITLGYSEAGMAGLDESYLMLLYWDGNQWLTSPAACDRDVVNNILTCTFPTPVLGEFALAETHYRLYLAAVNR